MKKHIAVTILFFYLFSLFSCTEKRDAYALLTEFTTAYAADGVIYSPVIKEGDEGYVGKGLIERIFIYTGDFPTNYAIFLNSHPDFGSECGVFVCDSADQCDRITEACLERIDLLGRGRDNCFVKRTGLSVFYSTFSDRERAERLWCEIIR